MCPPLSHLEQEEFLQSFDITAGKAELETTDRNYSAFILKTVLKFAKNDVSEHV